MAFCVRLIFMEQIITVNGKSLTIRKLPLRKYADLIGAFQEFPKHFHLVNGKSNDEILSSLPLLIRNCYADIVQIIHVATDLPIEEVNELGLDDLVKIIEAILIVNNYQEVYATIKKMAARPKEEEVSALN